MLSQTLTITMVSRMQFSLRSLFFGITGFSALCFFATHFGMRCGPLAIGVVVCAVRMRIALAFPHQKTISLLEVCLGFFCFVLSLALPVLQITTDGLSINGIQAILNCIEIPGFLARDIGNILSAPFQTMLHVATDLVFLMSILLGNLSLAMISFFVRRVRKGQASYYVYVMFIGAIASWTFPMLCLIPLKPGYYLWALSFAIIASPLVISRRHFIMILVLAATFCVKCFCFPLFSYYGGDRNTAMAKTSGLSVQVSKNREPASLGPSQSYNTTTLYTGQWRDAETDLYQYRNRYYHPTLGRFLTRDPIGYRGRLNLYQYASSLPTGRVDPIGLTDRSDIGDSLEYYCNCGWVDWGHATPGALKGLWEKVTAGKNERLVDGESILDPPFSFVKGKKFYIKTSMHQHAFGKIISTGVTTAYAIKTGLSKSEQESAALAIFHDITVKFETMQGEGIIGWVSGDSSFSEEDLPSNEIAFYRKIRGWSKEKTEGLCGCKLTPNEARDLWDSIGGLGKNKTFRPVDHNAKTPCCPNPMKWPADLSTITPAKFGTTWEKAVLRFRF